jgi:CO/xanthine dehydrogenase FAD-binding subunit/carbon monoxide dehydrogenase subunit G
VNIVRANSLEHATATLRELPNARVLAGGQSLLPAMQLRLAQPETLVLLPALAALREIVVDEATDTLTIGAACTHAQIAQSEVVRRFCPMLATLSGGIADAQVRNMGTIGGSLALNDPAACWPCGVLAMNAVIATTAREIAADQFFTAVYETALARDEIITAVRFPRVAHGQYIKFEQAASRFALVGVALVRSQDNVRIAITGLGHGVVRWTEAERALTRSFSQSALRDVTLDAAHATNDIHASADYRAHLARVLTRRCVRVLSGEENAPFVPTPQIKTTKNAIFLPTPQLQPTISGLHEIAQPIQPVWDALLDPEILKQCIAGCEEMVSVVPNKYRAVVRVGIGPISARFRANIVLTELNAPHACTMHIESNAGTLGGGGAVVRVTLRERNGLTTVAWSGTTTTHGKLAQFGSRVLEATATQLAHRFFCQFALALRHETPPRWWQRFLFWKTFR